jgi:hypothetical protein
MFKDLMHNILDNSGQTAMGAAMMSAGYPSGIISMAQANQILRQEQAPKSRKLFHGTVEVLQVANGYIVNIGRKEGYEYETYIAETITDVNERIAAAIVAFQLEGK